MLDILRPASSKSKSAVPPQRTAAAASPTASPASSTSTLKASSSSHRKTGSTSASTTARSRGQQARRQSIEHAVSSSHRHRYTLHDRHEDLLDLNIGVSSTSSRSSPQLAPFRKSTLASSDPHHSRGRSKLLRSNDASTTVAASSAATADAVFRDNHSRTRKRSSAQQPLLGGLYFSDLIVVAFFYAVNLLRTCGIAELVDVAFKALAYVCTRLPFDFYQRWSLSRPPPTHFGGYPPLTASSYTNTRHHATRSSSQDAKQSFKQVQPPLEPTEGRSAPMSRANSTAVSTGTSSSEDETTSQEAFQEAESAQLSPFHHLTLLLVRFACTSFPHLVPRVLFAEETIGPLVRWRTGGGAAGIVREFTSEQPSTQQGSFPSLSSNPSPKHDPLLSAAGTAAPSDTKPSRPSQHTYTRPGFRAFWIGADAHVPVEVRRADPSSKSAITLLYLHGGGFSLGSVAFYAEALIRIITKVCSIEDRDNDARCVAVEYDLGPTSRFPGPLLQCLRCYAHLIEVEGIDPASITIAGDSAGGNLAMAMLLCLDGQARSDQRLGERDWSKLPMPGKAVLISPWADLRPSSSRAFAHLREAAAQKQGHPRPRSSQASNTSSASDASRVSAWTEAISQHEWDYVAAEALMHFAQLYAGVLKTPRRVRGPMGWVAHMCAVLAGDEDDAEDKKPVGKEGSMAAAAASISATAPLAILRTLLLPPSQRIARVAHSMLTEPLLNRATASAKATFPSASPKDTTDAFNAVEHIRPSAVGAFDPIFPASERKTDAVLATADLYVPIWDPVADSSKDHQQDRTPEGTNSTSKDPDFEAAKALLETSKLVNPAIGDWSRIRLKRGMLVLWGDRERLADDIEVWIDQVRRSQSRKGRARQDVAAEAGTYDQPSQDSDSMPLKSEGKLLPSLQERRAASRSPHRSSDDLPEHAFGAAEWLCTAVEHGPGGVHAWPFVSMYLAGSEEEREKGLEIIARFISSSGFSPESTNPATPSSTVASLAVELPARDDDERYLAAAAAAAAAASAASAGTGVDSPPHLNAVSPAGSMPSDISSRCGDDYDFLPGSSYNGSEAEEDWDPEAHGSNELGLEGVYPHETVWNAQPTPTPSTGMGTPLSSDADADVEARVGGEHDLGHDELVRRVGLELGGGASPSQSVGGTLMEPVHLVRPAQHVTQDTQGWDQYSSLPAQQQQRANTTSRRSARRSAADPPTTLGGAPGGGRSLADLEAESDLSAPPSRPDSPGSNWYNDSSNAPSGYTSHEDNDDVDLSAAPSPQEIDRDAYFGGPVSYADDAIPMDPGFYGLAHYHTLRPEGLSDIAEEESQFDTSSVMSSGNGGGMVSPGFSDFSPDNRGASPTRGGGMNPGRYGANYTPSAGEMARLREALEVRERQYQERFRGRGRMNRFAIEEDEDANGESIGEQSVEEAETDYNSPWRSSAELPRVTQPESEVDEQLDATRSRGQLSVAVTTDAAASLTSRSTELLPPQPPSPARSTSSQTSSVRDVWW